MRLHFRGEYTPDWPEIKDRVRAEAGERCVRCHHPHDPFMQVACDERCSHGQIEWTDGLVTSDRMRCLTVHHMDGDKSNNAWWNLMPLCQVCHLVIQAKLIPERPYLWEHAEWAKPYIAGFYAKYYGNEDVTREQAVARMDELLALGQPWRTVA